jgi:hypothetical protein
MSELPPTGAQVIERVLTRLGPPPTEPHYPESTHARDLRLKALQRWVDNAGIEIDAAVSEWLVRDIKDAGAW